MNSSKQHITSSRLTKQINDLLGADENPNPQLRGLLTQLKDAIETEPELGDDRKGQAFLLVAELATAGQSLENGSMWALARHSIKALKNIAAALSEQAQLTVVLEDSLPAIASIFGV